MRATDEWTKIYREEGEREMWASIGASALLTALTVVVMMEILKK